MAKQIKIPKKNIKKTERHIKWNWEASPDNIDFVRYHFIVVDDKNRDITLGKILYQLNELNYGVEKIRSVEGKVKGSKNRYLFETHDSRTAPNFINWSKIGKLVKREYELKERQIGNIENYVSRVYEE